MPFKYLAAFNDSSVVKLYLNGLPFECILIDMVILNSQRSCEIKNVSCPMGLAMVVFLGDSIVSKIFTNY